MDLDLLESVSLPPPSYRRGAGAYPALQDAVLSLRDALRHLGAGLLPRRARLHARPAAGILHGRADARRADALAQAAQPVPRTRRSGEKWLNEIKMGASHTSGTYAKPPFFIRPFPKES